MQPVHANVTELYPHDGQTEFGDVVSIEGDKILVQTERGRCVASRAVSCLLAPEVDDHIVIVTGPNGCGFVTAILERERGTESCIEVPGDLRIRAPEGNVSIAGRKGIDLASASEVSIGAGCMSIRAGEGNVLINRMSYVGSQIASHVETIRTVAKTMDTVLDRLSQRIKRAYKTVEEMDLVRSHSIDYRADGMMHLRSKTTMVTAEELVRIDGEQIHLG